ncbi:MAG: ARMT1-like domain-containing protein [Bacteroidales bacterium]|jgi:hypothetical protein|nr:ARMT1-like domain-containing protein [Bacteroidales bacterium]
MLSDHRCFFCFAKAFEKLLQKENIPNESKNSFTLEMIRLYIDRWDEFNTPDFSRELHALLRSYTHNPDPYKKVKRENNDQAISLVPELKKLIKQSGDPFETALRLAIAGNIIDYAASDNFDLKSTIDRVLTSEFAIDHSMHLKVAIENAGTVLYLGDNAGEIIFDKLFIETINHPDLIFVVRGAPVINDATMDDAEYTGINKVAKVISNGYDAPSTIVNKSSTEFQYYFNKADLIISKGQGNLEGLLHLNDKRIFFLLMVKCNVMAEFLKVEKDSFVVYNASILNSVTN